VKRNGEALRYVEEWIFDEIENSTKTKMIEIHGKKVSEDTIAEALKHFFN
jgi:hypothetical protein